MNKRFGFLDCQLYSPVGEGESGYHFCGEDWLKGHFVKLNSNAGYVNETDYNEHSEIAQAFSHYTFDRSNGELLVVDLQGVCGGEGSGLYFVLTDPQVHSRGAFERFGPGDFGDLGVRTFFQKHKCNDLCRKLCLKKEYDLCEPTFVMKMPGVSSCIQFLGNADFCYDVRRKSKVSSMTLPREAHTDWLDIRIWANRKGVDRAVTMFTDRLNNYYEKARSVVLVQALPRWSEAQWQRQLEDWRRESGAPIIPYPQTWRELGPDFVKELWVFSECNGTDRWSHQNRNFAVKRIEETLAAAAAAGARDPGEGEAALQPVAPAQQHSWGQYQDRNGTKYWYREPDGMWFWESDENWQRFVDAASNSFWWWNNKTADWFYEPTKM